LIEDRRLHYRATIEGTIETADVIALQSGAGRDTISTAVGGQSASGRHSPEHNPHQQKKLRHDCFGLSHDFSSRRLQNGIPTALLCIPMNRIVRLTPVAAYRVPGSVPCASAFGRRIVVERLRAALRI
jgi:hypothetical protein